MSSQTENKLSQTDLEQKLDNYLKIYFEDQKLATVGALTTGIIHNISAPLTGILGYAELIKLSNPDMAEVDYILTQAKRIDEILKNIITISRRSGESREEEILLNNLLQNVINFMQGNLTFKHEIQPILCFDESLPAFYGIYGDIAQNVINIINFTIKAMETAEDKKLNIKTGFDDNFVRLEIKDSAKNCSVCQFLPSKTKNMDLGQSLMYRKVAEDWEGVFLGLACADLVFKKHNVLFRIKFNPEQGNQFQLSFPRYKAS